MRFQIAVTMLALLGTVAPASALTTLYTAPQQTWNGPSNVSMWCMITNVSAKPVEVTSVELLSFDGSLIIRLDAFTLDPLRTGGTFQYDTDAAVCRFIFQGSAKNVRASSCVHQLNIGCIATTPAQ